MVVSSGSGSLGRSRCVTLRFLLVLGSIGINLVLAALLDELGQVLHSPRARVLNRRVLRTGGEQLDGREASDRIGDIVGSRIDLGNSDLGAKAISVETRELVILRGKTIREWLDIANI